MKITPQGFAVLDDEHDSLLSRYCEKAGTLNHDPDIDKVFASYIKHGDVCVDAGAAIGDHTSVYILKAGSADRVHAFECNPMMVECLKFNCPGCNIYDMALSDSVGTTFFHQDHHNAGGSYIDLHTASNIPVTCVPLDLLQLPKVNFIKMDIEGHELNAIVGARKTIMRCRPIMILEMHHGHLARAGHKAEDVFSELKRLNYKWSAALGILDPPYNLDLLCEPL